MNDDDLKMALLEGPDNHVWKMVLHFIHELQEDELEAASTMTPERRNEAMARIGAYRNLIGRVVDEMNMARAKAMGVKPDEPGSF